MKVRELLVEASVRGKEAGLAMTKIVAYLEKKLELTLIRWPGAEHFSGSHGSGWGTRYILAGTKQCIRFNWTKPAGGRDSRDLVSIDIFDGSSSNPTARIETAGISFARALPALVALIDAPKMGKHYVFPVNPTEALKESLLVEARRGDFSAEDALSDFMKKLSSGNSMTRSEFIGSYHISNVGVFDTIFNQFGKSFAIDGRRVQAKPGVNFEQLKKDILATAGVVDVKPGGKEKYLQTEQEREAEESTNTRIAYSDVLEHLEGLVTGVVKGAFNALFVAGKGGVGKTQTVEAVLEKHGLSDGHGYYKNTGTASAPGVYTLLYHHRNDIILFDDCDGALADQDARNLIKSATDTKKSRKLVWNKKSSFIFDPDEEGEDAHEDDLSMAPKFFDFKGRIIFISNLPINKLDPDGALRTRAFLINVDPTDEEIFEHMEKILMDIRLEEGLDLNRAQRYEVLDVVKSSKRKGDVSLRKLVRALNLAASGADNWKKLVELYC